MNTEITENLFVVPTAIGTVRDRLMSIYRNRIVLVESIRRICFPSAVHTT